MDPQLWSRLPTELINRICTESVMSRPIHPFAFEVKTLMLLGDVIRKYRILYGNDADAFDILGLDLDNMFPIASGGVEWNVHRKWRSLTPDQRCDFVTLTS